MLTLTLKPGETWSLRLPDGTEAHMFIGKVTDRQVRMTFHIPDELRVTRDMVGAARIFKDFKP